MDNPASDTNTVSDPILEIMDASAALGRLAGLLRRGEGEGRGLAYALWCISGRLTATVNALDG
jgi:hypothetical protein